MDSAGGEVREDAAEEMKELEMTTYPHFLDLAKEAEPPADGILSKAIYQDDQIKAVVFGGIDLMAVQSEGMAFIRLLRFKRLQVQDFSSLSFQSKHLFLPIKR